jgi:hypothetical protein
MRERNGFQNLDAKSRHGKRLPVLRVLPDGRGGSGPPEGHGLDTPATAFHGAIHGNILPALPGGGGQGPFGGKLSCGSLGSGGMVYTQRHKSLRM